MATQYLPATSQEVAKNQNSAWWSKVLARGKLPQDTTELLFAVLISPVAGNALIVITDTELAMVWPLLTQPEKNFFTSNVLQANDPAVIAFMSELPPSKLDSNLP